MQRTSSWSPGARWLHPLGTFLCIVLGGILVGSLGTLAGCKVNPPVRLVTPGKSLVREIGDAVGTDALFRQREGLTLSGVREYPETANTSGEGARVERPVSLSLRPTGGFLLTVGTEETALARGYDGRRAWTLNPRGVAHGIGLGARAYQLTDGWLRTMLWLTPGEERFVFTPKESDVVGEEELTLKRVGEPIEVTMRIDAASKRPLSYAWTRAERIREVRFSDWREEKGIWFPYEVSEWVDGMLVHTDRFERRTRGTPRSMGLPLSRPVDTTFDDVEASAVNTRVDRGGRFYVHAAIDEGEPLWMLVDSGFGTHALDTEAADALGVGTTGSASLVGVGGAGASRWAQASTLRVGRFRQSDPRFVTVDMEFLTSRAGFEVAGILGSPLFERTIVTLDEPRGRVSVDDPRSFLRRGLAWEPLELDGSAPCIQGSLVLGKESTSPFWLRLDTGSDDTLTVARWASKLHDLEGDRTLLRATRIEGVFGTILGWRRRLDRVELGPQESPALRILQPEVTLLREAGPGPLSDPWIAGNLGTRALRGCRVILDVSGERVSIQTDQTQ